MYIGDPLREGHADVKYGWIAPLADALVVPELDLQSTCLLNTTRKVRQIPTIRKLSNVEDTDVKFRGHRDSVTLARSRLMHSSGIAPGLFAHKDSVSVARDHVSAAAAAADGGLTRTAALALDDSVFDSPTHTVQNLRSQKSVSALGSQQRSDARRHIRIVE
jgi:hypothetical protein